eukprot:TRINITY_DN66769_c4_g2_i1.p1 TRINITY_DN66769_c4_g2~~TRINITY_DN66769_c4_g2_i1.p1  ORF type:complete len:250 (+),score=22.84 TRINITY_DN66769_c4_g2_i1:332-1081(+)
MASGRNRLFVDVGANSGQDSSVAASAGMRVIAFEPVPVNQQCFRNTMEQKNLDMSRIRLIPAAVSSYIGNTTFFVPDTTILWKQACPQTGGLNDQQFWTKHANSATHIAVPIKEQLVNVTTLDAHIHDEAPFLLHADTQGAEYFAFSGSPRLFSLRAPQWIHMELWPVGIKSMKLQPRQIHDFMVDNGYACWPNPNSAAKGQTGEGKYSHIWDWDALISELGFEPYPHKFTDLLCVLVDTWSPGNRHRS